MGYFTRIVVFAFAILIVESSGPCGECPTFWTAFGGSCYRFFGQRVNLNEARHNCRIHGGGGKVSYLVSIHSQEEQDYVDALVRSYFEESEGTDWHVWIGLDDEKEEGRFVWTDSSRLDFTSWENGQPQGRASEQGVVMYYSSATGDGLWHDISTAGLYKYVCKMPRCF